MKNSEDSLSSIIRAACRVASVFGATIEEKTISAHRYFKFSPKMAGRYYLLQDNNQRKYIVREKANYYRIDVKSVDQEEHYIVGSEKLGKEVDEKAIFLYLNKFLEKRGYRIDNWHWQRKGLLDKKRKAALFSGNHEVVVEISKTTKEFLVRLHDKKEPYLCSKKEQYLLHLYRYANVDESQKKVAVDSLLKNYEESEIATSRPGLKAKIRNYFYGFYLPDLRKFYSEEGLIPEVKYVIKHIAWIYLAVGLLTAAILKRVTVRLSGNSWYIVFASLLAPVRIFSEMYYTRKSAVISEYMPSSLQSKISEKEEYRIINERKEAKSWRQFEFAYINLIKKNYPDWGRHLEHYRQVKPRLYEVVFQEEGKRKEEFAKNLNLPSQQFQSLVGHIENLESIKEEETVAAIVKMIEEMKKDGSIKESACDFLISYAQNTYPRMLREKTYAEASKLLESRIKEAARHPSRMELKKMLQKEKEIAIIIEEIKKDINE